ncbi:MAG: sugar phosphate isomerase/epimerase [Chitinophagaceae bacterium]
MSNFKRRDFLKLGTGLLGGFAIGAMACNNNADNKSPGADTTGKAGPGAAALAAFGLQLYTLRDDFPKDPKGVLKQVAGMGYTQVEGYEGPQGIFWGMSNTDFKKYTDELGISMVSSHCDISKDFEKKAAEAAAIGMQYLMCPWKGPQKSIDDFKRFADEFNAKGEICKKAGLRFAYHNHDYSFKTIDGQLPQEVMMANTDPALVDFEMDIYWVVTAGADPEAWLKKYPNRFRSCHIKDRSKTPVADEGKNSCDLGTGTIDFAKILKTARDNGMQYYIVEQEAYPNGTPLEAVKVDAAYMKALKF